MATVQELASASAALANRVQGNGEDLSKLSSKEILERVVNGALPLDMAQVLIANLSPRPASNGNGNGNLPPLVQKDGTVHGPKDDRPYRLCRRNANQVPMIYFMVTRATKGCGFGGGISLALPVLTALVKQHGVGALFARALADYESGSICYSRES